MKHYTENQYDDDLTIVTDDYDDSNYSDPVDLFEFTTDEEEPISRLKSLVLSIDWEITDEVLIEFNEELNDLKGIWAGKKINLVYVQALEKISKYIYQHKADSHPNAIKLLLTLYYNLEKIVSSEDLTESQQKALLIEDVKRFEALKKHISRTTEGTTFAESDQVMESSDSSLPRGEDTLQDLKAIVLGIDWEITDQNLSDLRQEVVQLEKQFASSKPKLILLQGIGTLCVYIKLKKHNSHADAFKLLHLFHESLEKMVANPLSLEDEKAILFPAVEKFNEFKELLGDSITSDVVDEEDIDEEDFSDFSGSITPAFADIPEEEVIGFQADEEAQNLGAESSTNVVTHIEDFFSDTNEQFGEGDGDSSTVDIVDPEIALAGVDVEKGDEITGELGADSEFTFDREQVSSDSAEEPAVNEAELNFEENSSIPEADVTNDDSDDHVANIEIALQGVDVESEADDDSDEEALPMDSGQLAPALAEDDEISAFSEETLDDPEVIGSVKDEIIGKLDGFFASEDAKEDPAIPEDSFQPAMTSDVEEIVSEALESKPESELQVEETLDAFFSDTDFGETAEGDSEVDNLFNSFEPGAPEELKENELTSSLFESDIPAPQEQESIGDKEVVFELANDPVVKKPSGGVFPAIKIKSTTAAPASEVAIDSLTDADPGGELQVQEARLIDGLGSCIDSLKIDSSDEVFTGLSQEIDNLHEKWQDKPLEKSFLQLLSTITQHIDQSSVEASGESHGLLKSVYGSLTNLRDDDLQYNQELLFSETQKVLQWQQGLISQPRRGDSDNNLHTEELRKEIASLRDTFLTEIAELRKEIKK